MPEFDVLVRGGTVFDGTGGDGQRADVGTRGGRVAEVGDLGEARGIYEVDAGGLAVAPGFIDSHTHSDASWALGEDHIDVVTAAVRQGVTTEVCGNCGFSPYPYLEERREEVERHVSLFAGKARVGWRDLDGFAQAAEAAGLHANLAPLVGHGTLRVGVMGFEDRPPRPDELIEMKRLLREAFEQGAFGLTTGLIYTPGVYARTEELIDLARSVAGFRRPYASHIRGETHMVAGSVSEAIRIGREAGLPTHISHHKTAGRENWGRTEETLGMIDAARREGTDVTVDVYPYTAGSTVLQALLPPWVQVGGVGAMVERLGDSVVRERIRREFEAAPADWENLQRAAGWAGIYISGCPGKPEAEGKSIVELADAAGTDEAACVFDLLVEQAARVTMIIHSMSEADVTRVVGYEAAMIGSDGIPMPGKPHPRWAGTFSRVLGRYSRRQHTFDLATAIRKMTSLPAERFGLRDRGVLKPGSAADLVVFDPATVEDRATYEEPLRPPEGVSHVFVNGEAVVADGELTGARPGVVLRAG